MGRSTDHLNKAVENEALAQKLKHTEHVDWAVTALFYSALQYLEAYLALFGEHPAHHGDRQRAFEEYSALAPVYANYQYLYSLSVGARYTLEKFELSDYEAIYQNDYVPYREFLRNLMPSEPISETEVI